MTKIQEDVPDLVVGVDFGMTYTGVAWTNLSNLTQAINNWPGLGDSHESKVPTRLVYGRDHKVAKWGFLCEDEDGEEVDDVFEFFKIYLDQDSIDEAHRNGVRDIPATIEDTKRLITDYLEQVYAQIKRSVEANVGPWKDMKVEFVFSIPTTWRALSITTDFERAVRAAGFGGEFNHTAKLELTEAEAAAVYVAGNPQVRFTSGDILLVCDAGGGTTDLGLIQVVDQNPNIPALNQVAAVQGVGIGSTMIDRAFESLIQRRLNNNPDVQRLLPPNLARKMARSPTFRAIKHNFGSGLDQQEYKFALYKFAQDRPGVPSDYKHPGCRIDKGRLIVSRSEIQSLFDVQIRGIVRRIDEQLEWMRINRSNEHVKYLVLSGGLGGSPYVKTQLEAKYGSTSLSIIRSQEPRLSVVKGLVMDRKQKLTYGTAALKTRIARASYGVLCRQLYNPLVHIGADVEMDHYIKGQKWATNQIDWLIRKGDTIDTDTARERPFTKKINPGDPNRKWDVTIIISHNDREALPRMKTQAGALKLCSVYSDLSEVSQHEFELKNKQSSLSSFFCCGSSSKEHYLATFNIRVIIAPADLRFELWFKGAKYNRSHEPVSVEWDAAGANARPPTREKGGMGGDGDGAWESYGGRPAVGRFRST